MPTFPPDPLREIGIKCGAFLFRRDIQFKSGHLILAHCAYRYDPRAVGAAESRMDSFHRCAAGLSNPGILQDPSGFFMISSGGCQGPDPPGNHEITARPPDFGILKTVTSGGGGVDVP